MKEEQDFRKLYYSYLNHLGKRKHIPFNRFKSGIGNPRYINSTNNDEINVIDKRKIQGVCTEKDLFTFYKEFGSDIFSIEKVTRKWISLKLRNPETKNIYKNFFEYKKAIFIDLIEFINLKPKTSYELEGELEKEVDALKKLSPKQRQKLEKEIEQNRKPKQKIVLQVIYERNPLVILKVLERANGICERCQKLAPFKKDSKNEPYLEVHHIIPLSNAKGYDTIENCIALCPNCHRHAHYGKNTYNL